MDDQARRCVGPWAAGLGDPVVIDLGHELHVGMPVSPSHPPFQLALQRRHGDVVRDDGGSGANEIFVTGGHVGTHVDAIGHISHHGRLHGGVEVDGIQTNLGLAQLGIEEFGPMVCRGVLLDIPALRGVEMLEPGYEVTADDLAAAERDGGVIVRDGDAVLVRTGWSARWPDPTFVGDVHGAPGVGPGAARWLVDRGVRLVGGETIALEVIRPGAGHRTLPVHRILLVDAGVHILEVADLRELAVTGAREFTFVAAPLKIRGATGAPVRPLALLGREAGND